MADYGAIIDVNGNPFITPASTPFCLYRKYTFQSSGDSAAHSVTQYLPFNSSYPVSVFIKTSAPGQGVAVIAYNITEGPNAGTIYINGTNYAGQSFTLTAYVFAIFPQNLPDWGMAIWDAKGDLVLTNESKVLSDLFTVNGRGIDIDSTYQGSVAVCPAALGALNVYQVQNGQQIIRSATAGVSCRYNGSTTRINAVPLINGTQASGGTTNGARVTAIYTAAYD
ncbi:hypothetical protein MM01_00038 [Escherichia phage vB_EcoS_MM01]|uniref:Uncharacterized protein n=1 Tax=Escherichia phage vB_EcoS_MM01 TaxID=2508188 RepID=A0A482N579_9CAUD|nr:hypothetical protein MM01_00038 [Escherichia phage vB_EcoS_MM01]